MLNWNRGQRDKEYMKDRYSESHKPNSQDSQVNIILFAKKQIFLNRALVTLQVCGFASMLPFLFYAYLKINLDFEGMQQ